MPTFNERLAHAWNVFTGKEPINQNEGYSSYIKPDRVKVNYANDRTIITSIFNRIAVDCASVDIRHVDVDENGRYVQDEKSSLNYCFSIEANKDQTGRNLIQDLVMTLFNVGYAAVVPTHTSLNPNATDSYQIEELRVGIIKEWFSDKILVTLYDEDRCIDKDVYVLKRNAAIIENPFYSIMNAPNSILRRLARKLSVLDQMDSDALSGKLNLLMKLPYALKSEARKTEAETRRKNLEDQMSSKLGIGYIDGTEQVIQLNRPLENNVMSQVEYLTRMLDRQLGNEKIWNGEASPQVMNNYYTHTIEPILVSITEEFKRKFLSKNAITRGQSIMFFRDPFKLVTIDNIADIGDKFTRNEIVTSNEVRAMIGMKPSKEPNADELRNKSLYPEENAQNKKPNINDYEIDKSKLQGLTEQDIDNMTDEELVNFIK